MEQQDFTDRGTVIPAIVTVGDEGCIEAKLADAATNLDLGGHLLALDAIKDN